MAINKFSLIGILLLVNVFILSAQVDKKYLAGTVPLVAGKVVFTRDIKVSNEVSKDQLFKLVTEWGRKEFAIQEGSKQRMLLADKDEGYVVLQGDEKLVFKSGLLMLDQTTITYQLVVKAEQGKCSMEMRSIKYEYQDYKKLMPAEEMITDAIALQKNGEKLNRHYDKFRTFTIDRVDELKTSLMAHLGQVSLEEAKAQAQTEEIKGSGSIIDVEQDLPQPAPSIKVEGSPAVSVAQPMPIETETVAMTPLTPATSVQGMAGYKQMTANQLSESIMNMFKDSRAVVAVGKDTKAMTAVWSGTGNFGGKPVAMTFVNRDTDANVETYTISFYTEIHGDALMKLEGNKKNEDKIKAAGLTPIVTPSGVPAFSEAWMIIECKKMTEQDSSEDAINENAQSKKWSQNKNVKLFMGEILNVWAR